ncbi:MAG: hypothetical protein KGM47_13680 [Acidobacteriota bacterium]|nr:hypothetical protein [Acidobacteriota bacterium]
MSPRIMRVFFYVAVVGAVLLWAGLAINLIRRTDTAKSWEWILITLAVAIMETWFAWKWRVWR